MKIWELVFNQVLMSMNGAIDINICAIKDILDLYILPKSKKLEIIRDIMKCWRYFHNKQEQEQELKNQNKPYIDNKVKTSFKGK